MDSSIDDFLTLFTIQKLSILKRHCKQLTISQSVFANFIFACKDGALPWQHVSTHRHFTPDHLILSNHDLDELHNNGIGKFKKGAQKAANKIFAMMDERRHLSGHMFFNSDETNWHFFYFYQRDVQERSNKWRYGPHIHFMNWLWPNKTASTVWNEFNTGNPHLNGSIHIRYSKIIQQNTSQNKK